MGIDLYINESICTTLMDFFYHQAHSLTDQQRIQTPNLGHEQNSNQTK